MKSVQMKCWLFVFVMFSLLSCDNMNTSQNWTSKSNDFCIGKENVAYEQLFDIDDLYNVLDVKTESVKIETYGFPLKDKNGYCYYSWPSGRPPKSNHISEHIVIPDYNFLRIENYVKFDESISKIEVAEIFKNEYQSKIGFIGEEDVPFEFINDLADNAFWYFDSISGGELTFLYQYEKLELKLKTSLDEYENLENAKKIVLKIISECN